MGFSLLIKDKDLYSKGVTTPNLCELYARVFEARCAKAEYIRYDEYSNVEMKQLMEIMPYFTRLKELRLQWSRRQKVYSQEGADHIMEAFTTGDAAPNLKEMSFVLDKN